MKNLCASIGAPALAAALAISITLISCGEGEIFDILKDEADNNDIKLSWNLEIGTVNAINCFTPGTSPGTVISGVEDWTCGALFDRIEPPEESSSSAYEPPPPPPASSSSLYQPPAQSSSSAAPSSSSRPSSSSAAQSSSSRQSSSSAAQSSSSRPSSSSAVPPPSSSSAAQSSSSATPPPQPGGNISIDDGQAKQLPQGTSTITCSAQTSLLCWSVPSKEITITCPTSKKIESWANDGNPMYMGECGDQGQGGSVTCVVPNGENISCKKRTN